MNAANVHARMTHDLVDTSILYSNLVLEERRRGL
jgi:hypothetical protein